MSKKLYNINGELKKSLWDRIFNIDEWHSFWIGWAEVMCPTKPRIPRVTTLKFSMTASTQTTNDYLQGEWHYYAIGRAAGVFTWLGLCYGGINLFGL